MTIRTLLAYPDPRLRVVAREVTDFGPALATLAADLLETLRSVEALGITACHVGEPLQVVVLQLGAPATAKTYVNPRIIEASAEKARHPEGSVALPGVIAEVERPARVRVAWRDLDGRDQVDDADGLLAVCLQHEIDQLQGVFWLERLSRLKRDRLLKRARRA